MSLTIGRLTLDDPDGWSEPVGEAFQMVGGVPTPGERQGLRVSPKLTVWGPGVGGTAAAQKLDRERVRRQLRSLLQNLPCRMQGLYVLWTEDPDQNGWYVPGAATFDAAEISALYVSNWDVGALELALTGRARTHRRAVRAYLKDRRLATTPRDFRQSLFSIDFDHLTALALTALPSTVSDVLAHGVTVPPTITVAEAGFLSASLRRAVGLPDFAVVSFEQAEVSRNLGDVVIYDRRGTTTLLSTGPQTVWEEVYGSDYPLTGGDVPVVENGLVRVSYDAANTDGLRVDRWTGSAWAEQGKITLQRHDGAAWNDLDTLTSAKVEEWTAERAVLRMVMSRAADASSREVVYVTLQRGWTGPRVEVYPARTTAGAIAGAGISWNVPTVATDDSAYCIDAASVGVIVPTAGSGAVTFTAAALGAASFGQGQNWAALAREGGTFDAYLAVLQEGAEKRVGNSSGPYGAARNLTQVRHQTAGYMSAHLALVPHDTHQELDNGDFTAGTGTTLSAADGTAIDGTAASTTRTTDANPHVTLAAWLTTRQGRYRVFARVRTTASTLNIYAKTTAGTGATKTTTSTTYVWLDLGEIVADGSTLEIHMWATAAATTFFDRLEAVRVEARDTDDLAYNGAADFGQSVLYDSRQVAEVVAR